MTHLSIVIPAYNEETAIRDGKLAMVREWLAQQPYAGELIVVDDESNDQTAALAQKSADRVISIPHAGKAAAVIAGIRAAAGKWVLLAIWTRPLPSRRQ